MPYDTDTGLKAFWAYGDKTCNLYDHTGQADWGYVVITNGGNANKQWRTLTIDEWNYIFTQRPDADQKYGRATIDGTHTGVVVLPDDWEDPYEGCFVGGSDVAFDGNNYTLSQWSEMEDAGALFWPSAGYRFTKTATGAGRFGRIWSSTMSTEKNAYMISYTETEYKFRRNYQRNSGQSVRLACE